MLLIISICYHIDFFCLFLVGTWESDHFIHQDPLLVAELGSRVIIPCSHSDDFINTVSWYKHSVGKKPLLIAYSEHGSGSVTYKNVNTNRYLIRTGTDSFNLTIIHLEEYDFATYYCAVSFLNIIKFGEGTILLRKGEFMTIFWASPSIWLHICVCCFNVFTECYIYFREWWNKKDHGSPGACIWQTSSRRFSDSAVFGHQSDLCRRIQRLLVQTFIRTFWSRNHLHSW